MKFYNWYCPQGQSELALRRGTILDAKEVSPCPTDKMLSAVTQASAQV